MKKIILLLSVAVLFFSCQNENVNEDATAEEEVLPTNQEQLEALDDGELELLSNNVELGEEVEESLRAQITSKTYGYYYGGGNNDEETECIPDYKSITDSLPTTVSIRTTAKPGTNAYFDIDILDSNLAGTDIPAWCVDQDLSLDVEGPLDFAVYDSYGDLPEGAFEKPENFDLVNWLINQDIIGTESPSGGTYTFGHVQMAIWMLVDDSVCRLCTYLTNPIGAWNNDANNLVLAQELADLAIANGQDFKPTCGEKYGIILVPEGKQAIIITKIVPAKEPECKDCEGKVSNLKLKFDWYYSKRVRIYQQKENSWYCAKIFDKILEPGEEFDISGINQDGSFGNKIYIYIGYYSCYYYAKINTNCYTKIGPGYKKGVFSVVSGTSTEGGELCEYEAPKYHNYHYGH